MRRARQVRCCGVPTAKVPETEPAAADWQGSHRKYALRPGHKPVPAPILPPIRSDRPSGGASASMGVVDCDGTKFEAAMRREMPLILARLRSDMDGAQAEYDYLLAERRAEDKEQVAIAEWRGNEDAGRYPGIFLRGPLTRGFVRGNRDLGDRITKLLDGLAREFEKFVETLNDWFEGVIETAVARAVDALLAIAQDLACPGVYEALVEALEWLASALALPGQAIGALIAAVKGHIEGVLGPRLAHFVAELIELLSWAVGAFKGIVKLAFGIGRGIRRALPVIRLRSGRSAMDEFMVPAPTPELAVITGPRRHYRVHQQSPLPPAWSPPPGYRVRVVEAGHAGTPLPDILPRDARVRGLPAPKPKPRPRRISNSPVQNQAADDLIRAFRSDPRYRILDARLNQTQVGGSGHAPHRMGINVPDVSVHEIASGRRIHIEFDRHGSRRGLGHATRALANDPSSIVVLLEEQ